MTPSGGADLRDRLADLLEPLEHLGDLGDLGLVLERLELGTHERVLHHVGVLGDEVR
jgi:hypothetical protein